METLFTTLHVVAAVFIVGPMAILPMTAMRAIRAGQGRQVEILARSTFIFSLLSLLVVVFGFGILPFSRYGTTVTTSWVLISLILYVVAFGISVLGVVPAMRSAAESLAAVPAGSAPDPGTAADAKHAYTRVAMLSGIASLLLLVIVVLMTWKP
jgi:uncharacterized membrane protein